MKVPSPEENEMNEECTRMEKQTNYNNSDEIDGWVII